MRCDVGLEMIYSHNLRNLQHICVICIHNKMLLGFRTILNNKR